MKEKNCLSSRYSLAGQGLLYALLLFTPLARGSVLLWQQSVIMIGALILVALVFLEKARTGKPKWYPTVLDKPSIALLLLALVAAIFGKSSSDSIDALALLFSYLAILYATLHLIRSREDQRRLVYVLVAMSIVLSFIAFLKSIGITLTIWHYEDLRYQSAMLGGPFGNHNHFAGYLEMVLPLVIILLLTRTRRGFALVLMLTIIAIVGLAHLAALSRGGWVSLALGLTFMTLVLLRHQAFKRKKLLLTIFGILLTTTIVVLASSSIFDRALTLAEDETMEGMGGRVRIWQGTYEMITNHPWLGTGPGTYATVFPQYQPPGANARFYQAHNDYLHYISELGILVIPIGAWFLLNLFQEGRRKLRNRSRQTWGITLGAMTGIFTMLCHSFVDFNLHIPANTILFLMLIALVVGGPRNVIKKA